MGIACGTKDVQSHYTLCCCTVVAKGLSCLFIFFSVYNRHEPQANPYCMYCTVLFYQSKSKRNNSILDLL